MTKYWEYGRGNAFDPLPYTPEEFEQMAQEPTIVREAVREGREHLLELFRGEFAQEVGEGVRRDLDTEPGHSLAPPRTAVSGAGWM